MTLEENFDQNLKSITQIYWENSTDMYLKGADFSKNAQNFVRYRNPLMPSGKAIKVWKSTVNFQEYKSIPYLPILINNQKYHIKIKAISYPSQSVIYRFNFYDVQGNLLNQVSFTENDYEFTFPLEATSYDFEIINGGCKDLFFERIQISKDDVPEEYFNNLVFKKINNETDKISNIILLADGKRTRLVPEKFKLIYNPYLFVVNVSWQFHGNLTHKLDKWIEQHLIHGFRVFSTSSKFDRASLNIGEEYPQIDVITSKELATLNIDKNLQVHHLYKNDVYDPNWPLIIEELNNYFRK